MVPRGQGDHPRPRKATQELRGLVRSWGYPPAAPGSREAGASRPSMCRQGHAAILMAREVQPARAVHTLHKEGRCRQNRRHQP